MWRKNRRNNGGGVIGIDLNRNYPHEVGLRQRRIESELGLLGDLPR